MLPRPSAGRQGGGRGEGGAGAWWSCGDDGPVVSRKEDRTRRRGGGEVVKKARTWRGWTQGTFTTGLQTDTLTNLLSLLWSKSSAPASPLDISVRCRNCQRVEGLPTQSIACRPSSARNAHGLRPPATLPHSTCLCSVPLSDQSPPPLTPYAPSHFPPKTTGEQLHPHHHDAFSSRHGRLDGPPVRGQRRL